MRCGDPIPHQQHDDRAQRRRDEPRALIRAIPADSLPDEGALIFGCEGVQREVVTKRLQIRRENENSSESWSLPPSIIVRSICAAIIEKVMPLPP